MPRLDRDAIKAAAQGHWLSICAGLGIRVSSNPKQRGPCPICGEGKDRFRFDDRTGNGDYYCNTCGPGDGLRLVEKVRRCTFPEVLQLVSDALGRPAVHQEPVVQPRRKAADDEAVRARWVERLQSEAVADPGRIAAYFISRGLSGYVPDSLRFHQNLWHDETRTNHPGIVAQVENLAGPMPAIHRIYLDADGNGKAKVAPCKKLLGTITGGGIRLSVYEPYQPLVLCEGIETGLAVQEATGKQTWACISAVGLELVQVPDDCGPIYIAGDLDKSRRGERAAEKLAVRLHGEGHPTITIMLPGGPILGDCKGLDWLDVLNGSHDREGVCS